MTHVSAQVPLTGAEKSVGRDIMWVAGSILGDCWSQSTQSLFDQSDTTANVAYEPFAANFSNVNYIAWRLFDHPFSNKEPGLGEKGRTISEPGFNDIVVFGQEMIDRINSPTFVGPDAFCARMRFAAICYREAMHIAQIKNSSNIYDDCDAERDAECIVLKFLDALLDDLRDPFGFAYTSIPFIENFEVQDAMMRLGVVDGDLVGIHDCIASYRDWVDLRKTTFFGGGQVTPPNEWIYFNSALVPNAALCVLISATGHEIILQNVAGLMKTYTVVIPTHLVVNAAVTKDPNDPNSRWTLVVVTTNTVTENGLPPGNLFETIYVDLSPVDGFPDCTPTSGPNPAAPPGPGAPPPPQIPTPLTSFGTAQSRPTYSVSIETAYRVQTATGFENVVLIHDPVDGKIFTTRFNRTTHLPISVALGGGTAQTSSAGAYPHLHSISNPAPGQLKVIFSAEPVGQTGTETLAVKVEGPITGLLAPTTLPGTKFAQAHAPNNNVNLSLVSAGQTAPVILRGNPGDVVTLQSVGRGTVTTLGTAVIGPDGSSAPVPLAQPIAAQDLIRASRAGAEITLFTPDEGIPISCAGLDETGDGNMDRIDVVANPGRIFISAGVAAAPGQTPRFQGSVRQALQRANPGPILAWTPTARLIGVPMAEGGSLILERIPGQPLPLFRQSLEDLNGDGNTDEAVAVFRADADASFRLQVFTNASSASPVLAQSFVLPVGFSPAVVEFADSDNDGDIDIVIPESTAGGAVVPNNGNGGFTTPIVCAADGSLGQRGLPGLNLFDIAGAVNQNGHAPGHVGDPFGPHRVDIPIGGQIAMSFGGVPNQPYVLLASPHMIVGSIRFGLPLIENQVDIADCDLDDIIVLFDPNAPVIGSSFTTGATGVSSITLPAPLAFEVSLQAVMFTGGPDVIAMTNAIRLRIL